jgi:hypothetical protein
MESLPYRIYCSILTSATHAIEYAESFEITHLYHSYFSLAYNSRIRLVPFNSGRFLLIIAHGHDAASSSSSRHLASTRSAVSKPSVNQL